MKKSYDSKFKSHEISEVQSRELYVIRIHDGHMT